VEKQLHLFVGGLFSVTGILLVSYGLVSDPSIYARSLGWNVNLWWGLVVTGFGLSFLTWWQTGRR
jgi:hypothetical protein